MYTIEYLFYGDDDMWVFLKDSKGNQNLVCDIGGVHSSVGEIVNLWDWINPEKLCDHKNPVCYDEGGNLICKDDLCDHKNPNCYNKEEILLVKKMYILYLSSIQSVVLLVQAVGCSLHCRQFLP